MSSRSIDIAMFDRTSTREEARRAHKLENIYHVGQHKIWDGREVLAKLLEKHGGVHISPDKQHALARVFSVLMWGELAAWKISAQLADALSDFSAKMAATSQVHDEARHFYVLHDYLDQYEVQIPPLDRATRALLETVLATDSVIEKLIGMQLFIESMALAIFKTVRELEVEPVLTELLAYYERDEARHVGLGVQHVPDLVRKLGLRDRARLDAYQLKILLCALLSLKSMEGSFRSLGVDPRAIAETGKEKMILAVEMLTEANGQKVGAVAGPTVKRLFDAACELLFPPPGSSGSVRSRLVHAGRALRAIA